MLKEVFLARLRDQPLAYRYPSALLNLASQKTVSSLKRWIQERMYDHPRCRVYQDLWWEFHGAIGDYKSILGSPDPRRLLWNVTKKGYPMSYKEKVTQFMGCEIKLKAPILIPRADTESWLNNLVPSIRQGGWTSVLDVGFGSGCISLGLARALGPTAHIRGIDASRKAFRLAQDNKLMLSLKNVEFKLCNITGYQGNHEVVISNPPYIRHCDRSVNVSPSTRRWESASALHPPRDEKDDGAYYHKMLVDLTLLGQIRGCRVLAMELDGSKAQYDIVRDHAKARNPYSTIEPISDGRRKYRAIKITL